MICFLVQLEGLSGPCAHQSVPEALAEIEGLLEAEETPGATITIKVVDMTAEQFDALPEFGGY